MANEATNGLSWLNKLEIASTAFRNIGFPVLVVTAGFLVYIGYFKSPLTDIHAQVLTAQVTAAQAKTEFEQHQKATNEKHQELLTQNNRLQRSMTGLLYEICSRDTTFYQSKKERCARYLTDNDKLSRAMIGEP